MIKQFLTSVICIYCALVCYVSGQQTGALPEDEKKSSDDSKFIPITSNSPKFAIGLGVLSPSYQQKFGDDGKTKLDFNQESGGYSYSLSGLSHPMAKSTDRSGSDDKKYSTDSMKTAGDTHQLTHPTSHYNPNSYSLSGGRSDYSSMGSGYPKNTQLSVISRQSSQAGPPVPQTYGTYGQSFTPNYGPMPGYGPPGYGSMPYQSYGPTNGPNPQYSQSGAYGSSAITPVASNIQSTPAQPPPPPPPPYSASPAPQAYAPPQPQLQYSQYMSPIPNSYGGYAQPMSPYGMSPYSSQAQVSPYGGYGSPYGGGGSMSSGYGMYGSPSSPSSTSYAYGGGSGDPLANLSPGDINTLRQLYGAGSSMSMSYMSPYSGGMGGYGGMGGSSGYGGYGGMGGGSGSSGGGLSSLISLFG